MKNGTLLRAVLSLFGGLLLVGKLQAHDVIWWDNYDGYNSTNPMPFYYPSGLYNYISVTPTIYSIIPPDFEPCIVMVNLNPQASTLISATVTSANPANEVDIRVQALRAPNGPVETAIVSGEWHATGLPAGNGCTAVTPNTFTSIVTVVSQKLPWQIMPAGDGMSLNVDAGTNTLKVADTLTSPWINVGIGQQFKLMEMPSGFLTRDRHIGGFLIGTVKDNSGNPYSGAVVGLLYGGATTSSDSTGSFSYYSRLPWGISLINITNPIGSTINIAVPTTNNTSVAFKVAMAAAPIVTNNPPPCNCTPWCAIGFGTLGAGGQTPVYYSGGANNPASGTANCGVAQVTVTPPSGPAFTIKPGSARSQNSGPSPASGTWTVSCTVCGITKTATVTVP